MEEKEMIKDICGTEITVGATVAFAHGQRHALYIGVVTAILPKTVRVVEKQQRHSWNEETRKYDEVVTVSVEFLRAFENVVVIG